MLNYQAMDTEEKHYKIWDVDYFVKLIPEKTFNSDEQKSSFLRKLELILSETSHYISKKGKIEYRRDNAENSKKQTGKFEEIWRDDIHGNCYHLLEIELKGKSKKKIYISEMEYDLGCDSLEKKAFEKEGFFAEWKEVPFEEIKE